ncbi:MAG: MFS transporter [Clostridia bacterium]|nr:MFS transporter [Clostridia bacterium]
MATLLIAVIYAAFIGLGIPDSLFGPAWPAMYPEFGLDVSVAGYVTPCTVFFTIISSLFSARLIDRFGTARVTAVSTVMTAVALFGYSLSPNIFCIILFSIPLGLGGGAIDSGLNNYVALHYPTATMSFLHCFYGVGVSLSPYLMSLALAHLGGWRDGYRMAALVQLGIALIVVATVPIWKRVHHETRSGEQATVRTLSLPEIVRTRGVVLVWMIFIASCSLEYVCGAWGSTYLVHSKGMTPADAAGVTVFYYAGMALGRFLSGVLSSKLSCWRIIILGEGIVVCALFLLALPLSATLSSFALFLIGFGNGPVFPNLVHLTPENFGEDVSQSIMGTQMASAYAGIMLMPMLFGSLISRFSTDIFPGFLLIVYALAVVFTVLAMRCLRARRQ